MSAICERAKTSKFIFGWRHVLFQQFGGRPFVLSITLIMHTNNSYMKPCDLCDIFIPDTRKEKDILVYHRKKDEYVYIH